MKMPQRTWNEGQLVIGPLTAWRTWSLAREGEGFRLRPVARSRRVWPPRRPAGAYCARRRFHPVPSFDCTCGLHAARELELLQRTKGPTVLGAVSLWGRIIEHELGYRARFAYPQRLHLVCPICFWQLGVGGNVPAVIASVRGGELLPLCEQHVNSALATGLSVRQLRAAAEVEAAVLEAYGVAELETVPGP